MMFLSGMLDIQTPYWQVLESVAKYRQNNTSSTLILSNTGLTTGHFGSVNSADNSVLKANQYAFIMYNLFGLENAVMKK